MVESIIPTPRSIAFTELNADATSTIVLIHGAFANSTAWNCITSYFSDYHLLMPDLHSHGRSRENHPRFSPIEAAELITTLIRDRAKNGKAVVIGHSLGAHVAIQIITRHHEVVDDAAILLGYNIWSELNSGVFAGVGWFGTRIGNLLPETREARDGRRDADGVLPQAQDWSFWKAVSKVICTEAWPQPWPARTLIIAAGNRGLAPVTDRPGSARRLRDIGVKGNPKTEAYWHDQLIHDWVIEKPEVFVEMVMSWLERKPLPEGFTEL